MAAAVLRWVVGGWMDGFVRALCRPPSRVEGTDAEGPRVKGSLWRCATLTRGLPRGGGGGWRRGGTAGSGKERAGGGPGGAVLPRRERRELAPGGAVAIAARLRSPSVDGIGNAHDLRNGFARRR